MAAHNGHLTKAEQGGLNQAREPHQRGITRDKHK
jgi:hypothetical protein